MFCVLLTFSCFGKIAFFRFFLEFLLCFFFARPCCISPPLLCPAHRTRGWRTAWATPRSWKRCALLVTCFKFPRKRHTNTATCASCYLATIHCRGGQGKMTQVLVARGQAVFAVFWFGKNWCVFLSCVFSAFVPGNMAERIFKFRAWLDLQSWTGQFLQSWTGLGDFFCIAFFW